MTHRQKKLALLVGGCVNALVGVSSWMAFIYLIINGNYRGAAGIISTAIISTVIAAMCFIAVSLTRGEPK
jgi:uncharacterized membrane protein